MATVTITSKGQVTIPKSIRDALKLDAGDQIEFLIGDDGRVRVIPLTRDIRSLKGMLPKPKRPVSVEEMNRTTWSTAATRP